MKVALKYHLNIIKHRFSLTIYYVSLTSDYFVNDVQKALRNQNCEIVMSSQVNLKFQAKTTKRLNY